MSRRARGGPLRQARLRRPRVLREDHCAAGQTPTLDGIRPVWDSAPTAFGRTGLESRHDSYGVLAALRVLRAHLRAEQCRLAELKTVGHASVRLSGPPPTSLKGAEATAIAPAGAPPAGPQPSPGGRSPGNRSRRGQICRGRPVYGHPEWPYASGISMPKASNLLRGELEVEDVELSPRRAGSIAFRTVEHPSRRCPRSVARAARATSLSNRGPGHGIVPGEHVVHDDAARLAQEVIRRAFHPSLGPPPGEAMSRALQQVAGMPYQIPVRFPDPAGKRAAHGHARQASGQRPLPRGPLQPHCPGSPAFGKRAHSVMKCSTRNLVSRAVAL